MKHFCLTCKYEPDWANGIGKCKLALELEELAGEIGEYALDIYKYVNPDEVVADGKPVFECISWMPKEKKDEYLPETIDLQ
jgi:hypothetical protein